MVKLIDENMFDTFEFQGVWCLDKAQKIADWSVGKLYYDKGNITLEIFGNLNETDASPFDVFKTADYDAVYGIAQTGENIVLSTVNKIGGQQSMPGLTVEKYRASNLLIINGNINTKQQNYELSGCRFSLTNLDVWLDNDMLRYKEDQQTGEVSYIVRKPKRSYLTNFRSNDSEFRISLDESGVISHPRGFGINIKNETRLIIEPPKGVITISQATKTINKIAKFFTVLLGQTISTKYVYGILPNELRANVFFSQTYPIQSVEQANGVRITPYFSDIKNELPKSINEWFDISSELELLVNDYLLTVTQSSVIENTLINLTEGIESFFRSRDGHLKDKIELFFKEIPNDMLDRQKLQGRLDEEQQFVKSLVNTRVFLTHGAIRKSIYKNEKLIIATKLLQASVRYFILSHIGFSDTVLKSVKDEISNILDIRIYNNDIHF